MKQLRNPNPKIKKRTFKLKGISSALKLHIIATKQNIKNIINGEFLDNKNYCF